MPVNVVSKSTRHAVCMVLLPSPVQMDGFLARVGSICCFLACARLKTLLLGAGGCPRKAAATLAAAGEARGGTAAWQYGAAITARAQPRKRELCGARLLSGSGCVILSPHIAKEI